MNFLVEYNGAELNTFNHNNDNSFLMCDKKYEFEKWLERFDCIFLGLSKNFTTFRSEEDEIAFVYKDVDGDVWWAHFPVISLYHLVDSNLSFKEQVAIAKKFLDDIGYEFKSPISKIYFN